MNFPGTHYISQHSLGPGTPDSPDSRAKITDLSLDPAHPFVQCWGSNPGVPSCFTMSTETLLACMLLACPLLFLHFYCFSGF